MSPPIHKRHDSLFRQSFSDRDVARAALEEALPESIRKHLDLKTLKPSSASFIDDTFQQSHADMIFEVMTQAGEGYLCLIEQQSTADRYMVLRLIEYICKAIRHHLRQGHRHYPVVVPVLIYNGTITPYPYPTDFFDYFKTPKIAKALMLRPFTLVDLSVIPDQTLLDNPLTAYPYLLLKYLQIKKDWLPIFRQLCQSHLIQGLLAQDKRQLLEEWIYFTLKEAELSSKRDFAEALKSESETLGVQAMSLLQAEFNSGRDQGMELGVQKGMKRGRKQGMELGVQKGMKRGREQKSLEIAKNLLRAGVDDALVMQATQLDEATLAALKED